MLSKIRNVIRKLRRNPRWALRELWARLKTYFAPRTGRKHRKIGQVSFLFDLDLDTGRRNSSFIRRMYCGAYEIDTVALMRSLLKKGDTFVDIGANVGYLSAIGADCVGPSGRVFSFEPHPILYRYLEFARQLNPEYRWETHEVAIGRERSVATLLAAEGNIGWNTLLTRSYSDSEVQSHRVEVRPLDEFLPEEHVTLLKIDVEGYDSVVLTGMEAILRSGRIQNLIVELTIPERLGLPLTYEEIRRLLVDSGYRAYETRPPHRALSLDEPRFQDVWLRLER